LKFAPIIGTSLKIPIKPLKLSKQFVILSDTPILLTVRVAEERGFKKVGQKPKFDFYKKAAALKLPNLIDVELVYGADTIKNLKKDLNGVPVVVAYHDLKGTPSSEEIANILKKEIDAGGDVAKIKPMFSVSSMEHLNLERRTLHIRSLLLPVGRKEESLV
jgi:3-dehydroquinate dehydratase-1